MAFARVATTGIRFRALNQGVHQLQLQPAAGHDNAVDYATYRERWLKEDDERTGQTYPRGPKTPPVRPPPPPPVLSTVPVVTQAQMWTPRPAPSVLPRASSTGTVAATLLLRAMQPVASALAATTGIPSAVANMWTLRPALSVPSRASPPAGTEVYDLTQDEDEDADADETSAPTPDDDQASVIDLDTEAAREEARVHHRRKPGSPRDTVGPQTPRSPRKYRR